MKVEPTDSRNMMDVRLEPIVPSQLKGSFSGFPSNSDIDGYDIIETMSLDIALENTVVQRIRFEGDHLTPNPTNFESQ